MSGMAEPEMKRYDTAATDTSSQSMEDVKQSSPTNPTNSTGTITSDQASSQSRPGTSAGRRRKVPDSVTPNACTNCKKARAKVSRCFPVLLLFLSAVETQYTELSTAVRRCEASLQTLRPTSNPRLLSL